MKKHIIGFVIGIIVASLLWQSALTEIELEVDKSNISGDTFCAIFLTAAGDIWGDDIAEVIYIYYKVWGKVYKTIRLLKHKDEIIEQYNFQPWIIEDLHTKEILYEGD